MQCKKLSHKELQTNVPDLIDKSEGDYLYHEGYVYYSSEHDDGKVFKRANDSGTVITAFEKTKYKDSYRTSLYGNASWSNEYKYRVPIIIDGYVHLKILHVKEEEMNRGERISDGFDTYTSYTDLIFKVKADGISDLETESVD